jgi:hypothetical protein
MCQAVSEKAQENLGGGLKWNTYWRDLGSD